MLQALVQSRHAKHIKLYVFQTIEPWLIKAEQHAQLRKFDVNILMSSRLAPDQDSFVSQVRFAGDYIKYGAARLAGHSAPKWDDAETTIADIRARIHKTVAYAQSFQAGEYDGAADRM